MVAFAVGKATSYAAIFVATYVLAMLALVLVVEVAFWRWMCRLQRDTNGMPPTEFASLNSPLIRRGRDDAAPVVGRGVLQVGVKAGSMAGNLSYSVRLSVTNLYLQSRGGHAPWYTIPRSAISGATVARTSAVLHLVGHRDVQFPIYTGAPLDALLDGRILPTDAASELTTKLAARRTSTAPAHAAVHRAQLVLTAICIVVTGLLATHEKWPAVVGVLVGAYLGVWLFGRLLVRALPSKVSGAGAAQSIRGVRLQIVVSMMPTAVVGLILVLVGASWWWPVQTFGAVLLTADVSVVCLLFVALRAFQRAVTKSVGSPESELDQAS